MPDAQCPHLSTTTHAGSPFVRCELEEGHYPETNHRCGDIEWRYSDAIIGVTTPHPFELADWVEIDTLGGKPRPRSTDRPRWPADYEWVALGAALVLAAVGADALDPNSVDGPAVGVVCLVAAALVTLFVVARICFTDGADTPGIDAWDDDA